MAQTTARLKTTGMHCQSCVMLIQMNVSDIDGVTDVSVDLARGLTQVTYDEDVTGLDAIVAEIEKAGYAVQPE